MRMRTLLLSALLATAAGWATVSSAASKSDTYRVNFKDVEISVLAETVAIATGKTFVLDPRVHGPVTLISQQTMNAAELYSAFAQVMTVQGYVLDESRGVVRVYPGKLK